jgi:ABC-2 type transport system ATP-binding protein
MSAKPLEVPMIEARGLVKHYRSMLAVDSLSFDVRPGTVTGFLGPNGAGKPVTGL